MRALLLTLALTCTAHSQFTIQQSNTTASLRGIHNVGNGVAWASGTSGTVLHTTDGGTTWQTCPIPPDAEKLDFRGVQAFDANTAIVMSSGKGDLSRLYKTTDACKSWKLIFTNPDKEGFWDALVLDKSESAANFLNYGLLIGDPVGGKFPLWKFEKESGPEIAKRIRARTSEAAFAASNSSVFFGFDAWWIATGGKSGARVIRSSSHLSDELGFTTYPSSAVPVGKRTESSGIFSIAFAHPLGHFIDNTKLNGVVVGGEYTKPNDETDIAAYSANSGKNWNASQTQPHGYRSSVAYDEKSKSWITVGPNGTDISTDDGKNWCPLTPSKTEAPDADKNWNALSLPYVVGPKGRIGKLNPLK